MTTVYVLKEYVNPNCNSSLTLNVYQDLKDAINERDRIRSKMRERAYSLEYGVYNPRLLIDVVKYEVVPTGGMS